LRPTAILLADQDGTVRAANPTAIELLGPPDGTCDQLVSAHTNRKHPICQAGCARTLEEGEQRDHGVVSVRGEPCQLMCSEVGGTTVVALTPIAVEGAVELTDREREILVLVARGFTGERIATRLGISAATVRTHVEHIRRKLGVRTRSQAVARALALGEIE